MTLVCKNKQTKKHNAIAAVRLVQYAAEEVRSIDSGESSVLLQLAANAICIKFQIENRELYDCDLWPANRTESADKH